MSVLVYEGGAGTGKTTSLISALEDELATNPLQDGQGVHARIEKALVRSPFRLHSS